MNFKHVGVAQPKILRGTALSEALPGIGQHTSFECTNGEQLRLASTQKTSSMPWYAVPSSCHETLTVAKVEQLELEA